MRSSASQIATAELCLRKWAWKYLDKIATEPNKYAAHGIAVHEQIATWLTKRTPPDTSPEGASAAAIIPHLPPPQSIQPRFVEVRFELRLAGIEFLGFVDLFHPEAERRPRVYDHKTTSHLKWAKTPAELVDDPQATLYAFWAMLHTATDVVDLQWTYATRDKKPKVQVVPQTVTKEEIRPRLERTRDTALDCRALHEAGIPAIEVPYDAAGCEAFGGCPFRELCNLTPQERMSSVMSQGEAKDNFLARLRARQASGEAPTTPHPPPTAGRAAPAVNPPAPATTPASAPVAPPTAPPAEADTLASLKVADAIRLIVAETSVDRLARWAETETRKTLLKAISKRMGEFGAALPPEPPPAPHSAPTTPEASPPPPVPPPAPVAAPSAPTASPVTSVELAPGWERETPTQAELAAMHAGGTAPGFSPAPELGWTLYVDCSPTKAPNGAPRPELASERIAHVMRELAKHSGVSHYKVIEYGKGVGIFAAAVARDLAERPPAHGIMITTASREAQDSLQAFEAAATIVIMGR